MKKFVEKNFLGQNMEFEGCKSCAIGNHQITNLIGGYIYDDGLINITADPEIPIVGFMVVGIKKHISKLTELEPSERFKLFEVINHLELIMNDLGFQHVLKFEDGYSSHWREWVIPANEKIFYNSSIGEDDEKSMQRKILYYEKYTALLLQCLIDKKIDIYDYENLLKALDSCTSYDELIEIVRKTYGSKMVLIVEQLSLLNMNFGRGKNLKNICNYAKINATIAQKNEVVEFAERVRDRFNGRQF